MRLTASRKLIFLVLLFFVSANTYAQEGLRHARLSSDYHNHKSHLKDSFDKFKSEKVGRIAFLGGSITYNPGWRDSIMAYFVDRFPETDFSFINAGIPSMGSTPAAFRLNRDLLSKGTIDLVFEEAAVNDDTNGRTALEQIRALEGIVRHLWKRNKKTDIVFLYFVDPGKMDEYRQGIEPKVIRNHQIVADYYRISEINLAKEVTERIDNGEFTWEDDFINLHPSPFGQEVYANSIISFLDTAYNKLEMGKTLPRKKWEVAPIDQLSYSKGSLIDIHSVLLDGNWKIEENWIPKDGKGVRDNYHSVPMLTNTSPNGSLRVSFKGSLIGIAVAAGPDAGVIEYLIDEGDWKTKDLYTKWSSFLHLPWYYTLESELLDKEHLIELRLKNEDTAKAEMKACRIRYLYQNH